jgi:hypothetical protein
MHDRQGGKAGQQPTASRRRASRRDNSDCGAAQAPFLGGGRQSTAEQSAAAAAAAGAGASKGGGGGDGAGARHGINPSRRLLRGCAWKAAVPFGATSDDAVRCVPACLPSWLVCLPACLPACLCLHGWGHTGTPPFPHATDTRAPPPRTTSPTLPPTHTPSHPLSPPPHIHSGHHHAWVRA